MHKDFRIDGLPSGQKQMLEHIVIELSLRGLSEQRRAAYQFITNWIDDTETIQVDTSGSTGRPKTIHLPKDWMKKSAHATAEALDLKANSRALLCIPARYIGGMMMLVRAIELGLVLRIVEPKLNLKIEGRFDFAAMIPSQVDHLCQDGRQLQDFGKIIVGGAPIPKDLEEKLHEQNGEVYATFGMTETASHFALRRLNGRLRSTFFSTIGDTHVHADASGRMIVRIPSFNELELNTTDLIESKDQRTFKWLGRLDNVINSGGLKIHPEKLEAELSPLIRAPFVIVAEDHQEFGQIAVLLIEHKGPFKQMDELIKNLYLLGPFKPRKVYLTSELRRGPSGKVLRTLIDVAIESFVKV